MKDQIIEKQDDLIRALEKMIDWDNYPIDRLDEYYELLSEINSIKDIALLSAGEQEQAISSYCGNPSISEDTCQVFAWKNNCCEGCEYRRFTNKNK